MQATPDVRGTDRKAYYTPGKPAVKAFWLRLMNVYASLNLYPVILRTLVTEIV